MQKQQHVGSGVDRQRGAGTQLQPAPGSGRRRHLRAGLQRQFHRAVPAASVDDDQIVAVVAGGADRGLHSGLFLEHGHDNGEVHPGLLG